MRIEYREEGHFKPNHQDIDFYDMRLQELVKRGLVAAECWIIAEDDDYDYEQQITQDNTHLELNTVSPHMDRLSVLDERDGDWWVWYRDENPNFEMWVGHIRQFGKTVETMYPQADVVELYMLRRLGELAVNILEFESGDVS